MTRTTRRSAPDGGANAAANAVADAGVSFHFACAGGYVLVAFALDAGVVDPVLADAAADMSVLPAPDAKGAVVAAYAPGGALGADHHDGDGVAGIWPDSDERSVESISALGSENSLS